MDKYRPGRIKYVFLILLGLLYIVLGIYIYWSRNRITVSPWGEITAALFILYGSWRTYRAILLNRLPENDPA